MLTKIVSMRFLSDIGSKLFYGSWPWTVPYRDVRPNPGLNDDTENPDKITDDIPDDLTAVEYVLNGILSLCAFKVIL